MIFEQIQKVFGKYAKTLFYDKIMQICESFFEKVMAQQRQLVLRVLSWEISKPKTFNEEALELASEKALTLLQTKRHEIRATTFLDEQEAKTGKTTSGQARVEKASKITDATLGPDLYAKEIRAMSVSQIRVSQGHGHN